MHSDALDTTTFGGQSHKLPYLDRRSAPECSYSYETSSAVLLHAWYHLFVDMLQSEILDFS